MKRQIKCMAFVLAAFILLTTPSFAVEQGATRGSDFFVSSSVYLYRLSGTSFEAWFHVTAIRGMDELGASSIRIQESEDGENWTTVQTFLRDTNGHLIAENTGAHSSYVTYTGTKGMYYRAKIILFAKNSSGWGSVTEYTATIKL